jgi:hypothetical protein
MIKIVPDCKKTLYRSHGRITIQHSFVARAPLHPIG